MRIALALALPFLALVACSSSGSVASPNDGGSDSNAPVDANGDACIDPVEGSACTGNEAVCGSGGNACCIGYVWVCDTTNHTWVKEGLGCACEPDDTGVDAPFEVESSDATSHDGGAFSCGASTTCNPGQYCVDRAPGTALPDGGTPGDSYQCSAVPAACASTPTCDCLKQHAPPSCTVDGCTTDASGNVTIACMGV